MYSTVSYDMLCDERCGIVYSHDDRCLSKDWRRSTMFYVLVYQGDCWIDLDRLDWWISSPTLPSRAAVNIYLPRSQYQY